MKLNNKGITLIEIIISIVLVSIVLIFLFTLLISVKDMNTESEVNSTYLINKALILKNIEEDLGKETEKITLQNCNIHDFYTSYPEPININVGNSYYMQESTDTVEMKKKRLAQECIKFHFQSTNDDAYLGIYYYKNKNSYVISYIHKNTKTTRFLPEFEKYNVDDDGNIRDNFKIKYSNMNNTTSQPVNGNIELTKDIFHKITIPIIGNDDKDYSIIISYYESSNPFYRNQ